MTPVKSAFPSSWDHLQYSIVHGMCYRPEVADSRHWPLCYTWIGYHRLMVRRELILSPVVNHTFQCVSIGTT